MIRNLTIADLPAVLVLQARAYPPELHDEPEQVEALIRDAALAIGFDVGGSIVGALLAIREAAGVRVYSIEVDPDYQRQGMGRALLATAGARLRGERLIAWSLPASRHMAESLGAQPTGRRQTIEGHEAVEYAWGEP